MPIARPLAAALAATILITSAADAQSARRRGLSGPAVAVQPRIRDGRPRDYLPPGTITATTPDANGNLGRPSGGGGSNSP